MKVAFSNQKIPDPRAAVVTSAKLCESTTATLAMHKRAGRIVPICFLIHNLQRSSDRHDKNQEG